MVTIMKNEGIILLALALAIALISSCLAQESRQAPQKQKQPVAKQRGNDTCGSLDDLALKIQVCSQPLMDLIEGTIPKWPRVDNDIAELCNQYIVSEKCIRDQGRKCAKGVQKTIISTLANSIQRVRKRECSAPSKYPAFVKTTMCIEKNQDDLHKVVGNITSHLSVIEKQIPDLDKKTTAVCCMVNRFEDELRRIFTKKCHDEMVVVLRLYRGVLEDVLEIICRKPKCDDVFRGYTVKQTNDIGGVVSALLRIVFSLGD